MRMNRRGRFVLGLLGLSMATMGVARPAAAHEKWFHETAPYPLRWDLFFRPLPLALVGAVLMATLGAILLRRARGGRGFLPTVEAFGTSDERRSALYGLVPAILGIHVAVPLLVNGVQGQLFSPDNSLPGPWKYLLGLAQTGIALSLFYGGLTRAAAVALAVLWLIGVFLLGPQPMLDNVLYLGIAGFFFLAGRGPIAIDRLLFPRSEPPAHLMERAVSVLRTGLGLSLIAVAFTEKLANLPLALAFLRKYPLNFTPALGIGLSDEVFVLCAGAVELGIGLWLLLNLFPREVALIAWAPTNLTLTIFNWTELVGHLPIYGILAILLLWGGGDKNRRLWLAGLRDGPLAILAGRRNQAEPGEEEHARRAA